MENTTLNKNDLVKILEESNQDNKLLVLNYILKNSNEFNKEDISLFFSKPLLKNLSNVYINYLINEIYKEKKIEKFEYKEKTKNSDRNSVYHYIKYSKYKQYIIQNIKAIKSEEIIDFINYHTLYNKSNESFKKKLIAEFIKNDKQIPLEVIRTTNLKYYENKDEIFQYIIKNKDNEMINYIIKKDYKSFEDYVLKNEINSIYIHNRLLSETISYYKKMKLHKNKNEILHMYIENIYSKYNKSINNIKNNPYEYKNYELIIQEYEKCKDFKSDFINHMYKIDKDFINIFINTNLEHIKDYFKEKPCSVNLLQDEIFKNNEISNEIIRQNIKGLFSNNSENPNIIFCILTYNGLQDITLNENILNVILNNLDIINKEQKKEIVIELIRPYFTHIDVDMQVCLNHIEKVSKALSNFDYELIKEINKFYINPSMKYSENILKLKCVEEYRSEMSRFQKMIQSVILITDLNQNTEDKNKTTKNKI